MGPTTCKKLLDSGGDSDLFGEILSFINDIANDSSKCNEEGIVEVIMGIDSKAIGSDDNSMLESRSKSINMLTFLMELSTNDSFELMKAMTDKALLSCVSEWIKGRVVKGEEVEGEDAGASRSRALEEIASRYLSS